MLETFLFLFLFFLVLVPLTITCTEWLCDNFLKVLAWCAGIALCVWVWWEGWAMTALGVALMGLLLVAVISWLHDAYTWVTRR